MTTKERIFYYDFLRAFAIIAVIICHIMIFFGPATTLAEKIFQLTIHDIGRMGVPIFLMISGALLLTKDYDLKTFLKKRFARIIYPFIFWMILILLTIHLYGGNSKYLWNIFIGNQSVTWYFWTLIGIYLFIPIIRSFIKDHGDEGLKYFLVIWFITIILNTFHSYPVWPYFDLNLFAGYVGYPILGYYLNTREFSLSNKKVSIIALAVTVISMIAYVIFTYHTNLSALTITYLNVPMIFLASGMFMFAKHFDGLNSINSKIKDGITSISVCSYGMYFSHVIVLKWITTYNQHSDLMVPVFLILTVFLSWLPVYVMSKIPYLKKVSGV